MLPAKPMRTLTQHASQPCLAKPTTPWLFALHAGSAYCDHDTIVIAIAIAINSAITITITISITIII